MGCPVNGDGYGSRFAFSPVAKIIVLSPSSWRQATVHRTVAFDWFDSLSYHNKKHPLWGAFYYGAGYGSRTRLHGLGNTKAGFTVSSLNHKKCSIYNGFSVFSIE